MIRRQSSFIYILVAICIGFFFNSVSNVQGRRRLQQQAEEHAHSEDASIKLLHEEYQALGEHLCGANADETTYPQLPYHDCHPNSTIDVIPFFGGMTNGLKFVLLGSLVSFQRNRCFIITEQGSHLHPGFKDGTNTEILSNTGFNQQYFATIGLPHDDPYVQNAIEKGHYRIRKWEEYWYDGWSRKMKFLKFDTPKLGYENVDGHSLKRNYIHRLWRLKPEYKQKTCTTLREKIKIDESEFFVAYSVRRGDKDSEGRLGNFLPPMELYINATQVILDHKQVPPTTIKIFVATDDCTVLSELRQFRPTWNFVSACKEGGSDNDDNGYHINHVQHWSGEQRDEHFTKFFVELYALALSPIFSKYKSFLI